MVLHLKTVPALYQWWCFTAPTIVALQKVNHVDNRVHRNSMLQNVIRKSSSENNCQRRTYLGHLRIWLRPTLPSSPHNFPFGKLDALFASFAEKRKMIILINSHCTILWPPTLGKYHPNRGVWIQLNPTKCQIVAHTQGQWRWWVARGIACCKKESFDTAPSPLQF